MYDKQALIALVRQKALKFGQFTLASGKKATYYLDGKQVTLDPAGARLVAEGLLDLLVADGDAGGRRRDVDRRRPDHGRRGHDVGRPRHAHRRLHGPQGIQGARHQPVHRRAGPAGPDRRDRRGRGHHRRLVAGRRSSGPRVSG